MNNILKMIYMELIGELGALLHCVQLNGIVTTGYCD